MNDLEITRLCSEAMGFGQITEKWMPYIFGRTFYAGTVCFNPIKDDELANRLANEFGLHVELIVNSIQYPGWPFWIVRDKKCTLGKNICDPCKNRAICECVAKMQKAKHA